jgi:hypothetical protein
MFTLLYSVKESETQCSAFPALLKNASRKANGGVTSIVGAFISEIIFFLLLFYFPKWQQ